MILLCKTCTLCNIYVGHK